MVPLSPLYNPIIREGITAQEFRVIATPPLILCNPIKHDFAILAASNLEIVEVQSTKNTLEGFLLLA